MAFKDRESLGRTNAPALNGVAAACVDRPFEDRDHLTRSADNRLCMAHGVPSLNQASDDLYHWESHERQRVRNISHQSRPRGITSFVACALGLVPAQCTV